MRGRLSRLVVIQCAQEKIKGIYNVFWLNCRCQRPGRGKQHELPMGALA